jgi:ribokinase
MKAEKNIVIIGSTNMDLVVKAPRFPRPGETMTGDSFYTSYGGKGANQAVTVARLGAPVAFVGCVGDDAFGEEMVEHLNQEGVGTAFVRTVKGTSSGTALIIVDSEGRNEIIVVRGANDRLRQDDIQQAEELIASAEMVVIQLEIPPDTVRNAITTAPKHRIPVILNPAPAPAEPLEPEMLEQVFILAPNEVEAEALTGIGADTPAFAEKAIRALKEKGAKKVIITLGEKGCVYSEGAKFIKLPAYKVKAEDTTAAGDAFVGALAAGYPHFSEFCDAVRFALAVAALSVTKRGAQTSLPQREEVRGFLKKNEPSLLKGFAAIGKKGP